MSFIHLRTASAYSLKYGTTQPRDLVARASEFDMPALALTDRDGLAGATVLPRHVYLMALHRFLESTYLFSWVIPQAPCHGSRSWHIAMGDGAVLSVS